MNILVQIVVRLSTSKLDRARDTKRTAKIYVPFVIKVEELRSLWSQKTMRGRQYEGIIYIGDTASYPDSPNARNGY